MAVLSFEAGSRTYEQVAEDNGLLNSIIDRSAPVLISVADHMESFAELSESDWRVKYSLMALQIVAGPMAFVVGEAIEQTPIGGYIEQGNALAFNGLANHLAEHSSCTPEEAGKIAAGSLVIVAATTVIVSVRQVIDNIKDLVKWRKGFDGSAHGERNLVDHIILSVDKQRALLREAMVSNGTGLIAHHVVPLEALKRFPEFNAKSSSKWI